MKKLFLISCLGLTQIAHAGLTVVQDLPGSAPLSNYVNMNMLPQGNSIQDALAQAQNQMQGASIDTNNILLPQAQSEFTPGSVTKHKLSITLPMPFYLIGGDDNSVKWATQNAAYLKSIGAQGFIVDVNSTDQIKAIEDKTGLNFMPGSVQGLSSVVGTNHYPFLAYNGWVMQ